MSERTAPSETSGEFLTLHEFVKAAKTKLSANIWDYLVGGADSETTLRRNRLALDSLAFRPRVLRDVSRVDPSGTLLARKLRIPLLLAPVGSLESFDAGGAAAAGRAASAFGVPIMVSSVTQPGLEASADAACGMKLFQLYVRGDDAWSDDFVKRAAGAGYDAFCFTVDTAHYSRRERDIAKRFVKPWRQRATGQAFQAGLNWDHVKRYKDKHELPLILKGIATSEDAALACEHGAAGVYVSNHGGRQLDHGRGTLDILPEVVAAVKGRAQIIIDGGFCRGTDVLKALALGADAVAVGRLYCFALAAAGEAGVRCLLELLEAEIVTSLGLLGVTRFAALDPSYLHPAPAVTAPHVLSAFPLLNLADEGYGGVEPLPRLAERPDLDVEGPGRAVLMRDVPDFIGNRRRLDEEVVGPILEARARPRDVDHRVDDEIGDMHPLWSEVARHRLGQDALRRLGRREAGEAGLAAQRRGVAGDDDGALARALHRRRQPAHDMEQAHGVDLEIAGEQRWLDLAKRAEAAGNCVVDKHRRRPERGFDRARARLHLRRVRDVANKAPGVRQFAFERLEPVPVARQHRDAIAAGGKAAGKSGAGARADAGHHANGFCHAILLMRRAPMPPHEHQPIVAEEHLMASLRRYS
jgi:glycolate oxidase